MALAQHVLMCGRMASRMGPALVASQRVSADYQQTRNMATLKEVKARIRSVSSIQKITKSMKLVATTRLKKAEEAFEANRPSLRQLDEVLQVVLDKGPLPDETPKKTLVLCFTTERGLCGSVNSSVNRVMRRIADEYRQKKLPGAVEYTLLGNKAVQAIARECGPNTQWSAKTIGGRNGVTFQDIVPIAERLAQQDFDKGVLVRNKFVNLLTFNTLEQPIHSKNTLKNLMPYGFLHPSGRFDEVLGNFYEWYTAIALYSIAVESYCIEIGQRMTSMDNATKNAGDLIKKLTMQYNRRRQANITTEITEIVSGAAAVEDGA